MHISQTRTDAQESAVEGFLSIDVSKDHLDAQIAVGLAPGKVIPKVPNQRKGWHKLFREAKSAGITRLYVTMEATGSYWKKVARFFYDLGATVFVVNPARIKGQRKAEHKRSKTDPIDAGLILNFTRAHLNNLRPWSPPSETVSELQSLVRFRDMRVGEQTRLKNLIKSGSAYPLVLQMARQDLAQVGKEIKRLEDAITKVLSQDPLLREQAEAADTVPGVGLVTTAVLVAECRGFNEIANPRQATAFAGLDVEEETSGTMRKPPRISHKGNSLLRKTFVCAAAAVLRSKNGTRFREFYQRLRAKGMKRKPALVAVGRKLLEITVAVVLSNSKFDPAYLDGRLLGGAA